MVMGLAVLWRLDVVVARKRKQTFRCLSGDSSEHTTIYYYELSDYVLIDKY